LALDQAQENRARSESEWARKPAGIQIGLTSKGAPQADVDRAVDAAIAAESGRPITTPTSRRAAVLPVMLAQLDALAATNGQPTLFSRDIGNARYLARAINALKARNQNTWKPDYGMIIADKTHPNVLAAAQAAAGNGDAEMQALLTNLYGG
jgi:hypothetical protein